MKKCLLQDEKRKSTKVKKKKELEAELERPVVETGPCFVCGKMDAEQQCSHKNCEKYYHLQCVSLEFVQEGMY